MKTPPLLIGAGLVFWGLLTGHYVLGLLAAVFLEGFHFIDTRWELSQKDYFRVWDFCTAVFAALFVYFYASREITASAFAFMQWLPIIFLPIMAAQWLGDREQLPYRVFYWLLRRRPPTPDEKALDISYLYWAICLLAGSAVAPQNTWFYIGFSILMLWALLATRPRRSSVWLWIVLLTLITAAGYQTQIRLHDLQTLMEYQLTNWIFRWARRDIDVREIQTSMGRIGRLQLSSRIIYRLETDGGSPAPDLLRETSYNTFRVNTWYAFNNAFAPVPPETNDVWTLLPDKHSPSRVTISASVSPNKSVLPMPAGAARIENMPSMEMETNLFGVVRVSQSPAFVQYQALHGPGKSIDGPPTIEDLRIPETDLPAISQVASNLNLTFGNRAQNMRTVERFFESSFKYTTFLDIPNYRSRRQDISPLTRFLLQTHAGHCEYFATATTLLLRQARIPTRYATGFAVVEAPDARHRIIRERHAHAWCMVWNEKTETWEDFDTTPASWNAIEAARAPWYQAWSDFWSRMKFEFDKWRYSKSYLREYAIGLSSVLALVLAWRIAFTKRKTKNKPVLANGSLSKIFPGQDSEFYEIERRLAQFHAAREPGETAAIWLSRIQSPTLPDDESLETILALHYRYRFDPMGLDEKERQNLRRHARQWLAKSGGLSPTSRTPA
jgi:hypothetical protein